MSPARPQQRTKPVALTAHARHWPAAIDTAGHAAGGAATLPGQSLTDQPHAMLPLALSAHVPVERAASATMPGSVGTIAAPSPATVVAHVTAPAADKAQKWCQPATTAAKAPVGTGLGGL